MIGEYPTVGCLIVLDRNSFPGIPEIICRLQQFIPLSGEHWYSQGPSTGRAALGGEMCEVLVYERYALAPDPAVFFFLDFDEEKTLALTRSLLLSFEQLLMPYVQAAKTLPGVRAVALGFEMSPFSDLSEKSLRGAGVSVLFTRDGDQKSWSRKQVLPMLGHPQ